MLMGLFRRSANRRIVDRLHGGIVSAVRRPVLYTGYGVADTFDGRFELLALISTLVVRRLTRLPPPGGELAQDLTDSLFRGLDDDFREMGVGDLAVPKRIKKFAAALLGRRQAYAAALDLSDNAALVDALWRNVHSGNLAPDDPAVARLACYARAVEAALATTPLNSLMEGPLPFPDPETIA